MAERIELRWGVGGGDEGVLGGAVVLKGKRGLSKLIEVGQD
jgi:hypothetical protein